MERRHLTREEMIRAVGLLDGGMTQTQVAVEMGTTQSVISRLYARYREEGDVRERHRGRDRITTPVQDRFLQLNARRRPTVTAPELQIMLQQVHNAEVSADTVRRRLHENNLRSRRPLRVQPLSWGNRGLRLLWAQEHSLWQNENWARVLFSDESRFGIYPDSRRVRVWREPNNANRLRNVQEVHSFRGGTVMVWGGISIGGRTDLILLENFLTGRSYVDQILAPVVVPYAAAIGPNFVYMHDNARPHTSRIATEFLENSNIDVLPWPAQSPDLNPIEHMWDMLGRRLLRMERPRENRRILFLTLREAWNEIPQQDIDNLILSMPRRCREVVTSRGGHTNY